VIRMVLLGAARRSSAVHHSNVPSPFSGWLAPAGASPGAGPGRQLPAPWWFGGRAVGMTW